MRDIVGIGACVFDTLMNLPHYPKEDTKLRADNVKCAGGGPCATGLVAASKLGVTAAYIGNLSDDTGGKYLFDDFEKYGVGTEGISLLSGYRSFTSVLWLSAESTSRTCVFDKGNLPPLTLSVEALHMIENAKVLMVDGNELDAAVEAAKHAKKHGTRVLYDCGGLYPNVARLLALTDIMIPSAEFAMGHTGCATTEEAAKRLYALYSPSVVVVTEGKNGGLLFDGEKLIRYPIYPAAVLDSNGSGDVFHGAFAAAVTYGYDYEKCCHFASATSALKCMGVGARESAPTLPVLKKYLEENGYEL